ncbi:MAG: hypothetical protein V3T87_02260 [Candidatus Thorarchaeota archaeon]
MENWVLGIIGAIIASVVSGIILRLIIRKRAERRQDKRQTAKVKNGEVVQAHDKSKIVIDRSVGKKVFQGVSAGPFTEKAPQTTSEKDKPKPEVMRKPVVREISVEPGDMEKITEYIEKGSRVQGLAEESYSDFFYFYIVDDKNYEQLKNEGEPKNALFMGLDEAAYHFDVMIPHSGFWHFVFDAYGLKVNREIDFRCTILRKEGN